MEVLNFSNFIGNSEVAGALRRSFDQGRVSNAYLLYGPPGTGRTALALACAAYLNCTSISGGDACGKCPSCLKAAAGTHPDIRVLQPEKGIIKIDAVRALLHECSFRPFEGRWRVCILDDAERLGEGAANALLKTLEEVPGDTAFFLTAGNPYGLLPTVLSRCQAIGLRIPGRGELEDGLRRLFNCSDTEAAEIAEASGCLPARAVAMVSDNSRRLAGNAVADILTHLDAANPMSALKAAEMILKTSREYAGELSADGERPADGICTVLDSLCRYRLEQIMADEKDLAVTAFVSLAEDAKKALRLNANPQLTLESFALQLMLSGAIPTPASDKGISGR